MTPSIALLALLKARDASRSCGPYVGPTVVEACADFDTAIYDAAIRAKLGIVPGLALACTAANCPLAGS